MIRDYMSEEDESDIINRIGLKRFNHCIRVADTAYELAEIHNVDKEKAYIAGLYHDCGKIRDLEVAKSEFKKAGLELNDDLINSPQIIHQYYGRYLAEKKYGIKDKDILNAICYHATGRENMTDIEKIVFLADYIEPMRNFKDVENARILSKENLDKAMLYALDRTIEYLIAKGQYIGIETIISRNFFIRSDK